MLMTAMQGLLEKYSIDPAKIGRLEVSGRRRAGNIGVTTATLRETEISACTSPSRTHVSEALCIVLCVQSRPTMQSLNRN